MGSYKNVEQIGSVGSVSDAISELQSLGEECREIVDNAEGGLKETSRIQTFEETAGALEGISEPDVPECVDEVQVIWYEQRPRRKARGASRAVRCANAVALLQAASEAAQGWLDDTEAAPEDTNEPEREEVQDFIDGLDNIISDAENCEFPGMFG